MLQQPAAQPRQIGRQRVQPAAVVPTRRIEGFKILVEAPLGVRLVPDLLGALALRLHARVPAPEDELRDFFARHEPRSSGREVLRQQAVHQVPRLVIEFGQGQGQELQPCHMARQGLLRLGGAEDVGGAGEQELPVLPRFQRIRGFLDGGHQRRRILELVQHHPPGPQGAHKPMGVACGRSQDRLVIQGDVLHAQFAGHSPGQGRLPCLPRPGQIDNAELGEHLLNHRLKSAPVHSRHSLPL